MTDPSVFLAADIGGTHARFLLARRDGAGFATLDEATLPVAMHETAESACAAFIARTPHARISRACLAVAGPIEGRSARLTNAPWRLDADAIASRFSIGDVALCNDFEAAGYGLDALDANACVPLQGTIASDASQAPRLLIGAGTGLGVAYVLPGDRGPRVVAGEGGHAAFAPADDEQVALWQFLRASLARITDEHLLSGAGLVRLYAFATRHAGGLPDDVRDEGGAAVDRRFVAGESAAAHAVRLFASILGAVAGDHALAVLATGGTYVAGGVAPRFLDVLRGGTFVDAFNAKGAHAALMQRMPVCVVRDGQLGLKGAMLRAMAA